MICLKASFARTLYPITNHAPPLFFHTSAMSKRGGESTGTGNPRVKKRKGVKIRTTLIPDSDEEVPTSNVNTDYARWVKTRVTTSGGVESVTMSSVPLVEVADNTNDLPPGVGTEPAADIAPDNATSATQVARRNRKKENDSVSLPTHHHSLILLTNQRYRQRCTRGLMCGLLCSTRSSVSMGRVMFRQIYVARV